MSNEELYSNRDTRRVEQQETPAAEAPRRRRSDRYQQNGETRATQFSELDYDQYRQSSSTYSANDYVNDAQQQVYQGKQTPANNQAYYSPWNVQRAEPTGNFNDYNDNSYQGQYDPYTSRRQESAEPEKKSHIGLKILLSLLVIALLLCAALYFIPNAGPLQPVKDKVIETVDHVKDLIAPKATNDPVASSLHPDIVQGYVGKQVCFQATTNQMVENVRLICAESGKVMDTDVIRENSEETNRIWSLDCAFNTPLNDTLYLEMYVNGHWIRSDKSTYVNISGTVPAATSTPEPVIIPTEVPTPTVPVITAAPTSTPEPTDAPTPEPTPKVNPEILSLRTVADTGFTDNKIMFILKTIGEIEAVGIQNEQGEILATETSFEKDDSDPGTLVWRIRYAFERPYQGDVTAVLWQGDGWVKSEQSVAMNIVSAKPATVVTVDVGTPVPATTPAIENTPEKQTTPVVAMVTEPVTTPAVANTPIIPTATPAPEKSPVPTATPVVMPTNTPAPTNQTVIQAAVTWAPVVINTPTLKPSVDATEYQSTDDVQPIVNAATPAPTEDPAAILARNTAAAINDAPDLPVLTATNGTNVKVTDTVFIGSKAQKNFQRTDSLSAPNPDNYSFYENGVITFRGDNFRRNAAFGTVDVQEETLSVLWTSPIGSLRTSDSGTLYGVGWTGQPAIVKWTGEVRNIMRLYDDAKNFYALREVIFGAQDGKIYFLNLLTGKATRDPINIGYPMKGSVSIDNSARPLMAIGQGISNLPSGTGSIGVHLLNLIDNSELLLVNGRKSDTQIQYSTNGAFDGTPLFLWEDDTMVVAGENGLLYAIKLNAVFDDPTKLKDGDTPRLTIDTKCVSSSAYLRTKANAESETNTSVESSVAMYDKYIFMADTYGIVRCVDSDTMTTVWAFDAGDNTDAAIALDYHNDTGLRLYTANTAYKRLSASKGSVSIRCLDAMSGEQIWEYQIKCDYDTTNQLAGCKASPVIGQNDLDPYVYFTVSQVSKAGSRLIAFDKRTGAVVWSFDMVEDAVSSPVAVYNDEGCGWIIQADQGGTLHLLNGLTGEEKYSLPLGGTIMASPAVYKNILVIGTCDKNNSNMYGIEIR